MTSTAGSGLLDPESDTLSPLPSVLHQGLTATAVLAFISFFASTSAFLYLTYKLVRWHIKTWRQNKAADVVQPTQVDLSLGLAERYFGRQRTNDQDQDQARAGPQKRRGQPNQFLVLVYNLFLADMHQSVAFLLNSVWVSNDAILVQTFTCKAQGWFISNGDLASSCFITSIALHTYLTLIRGYKPPAWLLYSWIVGVWIFTYGITVIGLGVALNGRDGGGFYVRASAWCWINIKYEQLRLLTHYLFIFTSLAFTSIIYSLIFFSLRGRQNALSRRGSLASASTTMRPKGSTDIRNKAVSMMEPTSVEVAYANSGGSHPGFFVYPVIYVVCTAPLALGRIVSMAGVTVPLGYFCAAGALISCNGFLDVLVWSVTRRSLLFSADVGADDDGPETFAFMRTPVDRRFGNMVWVQGATQGQPDESEAQADARSGRGVKWLRERMGWWPLGSSGGSSKTASATGKGHTGGRRGARSISQESLRGAARRGDMAIQLDVVTTVAVELDKPDHHRDRDHSSPRVSAGPSPLGYTPSANSSEKEVAATY